MARQYRIEIDLQRCVGSTLCVHFAPQTFDLNEEGQSRILNATGDDADAILEAASQCPQCAITLTDADTDETVFP